MSWMNSVIKAYQWHKSASVECLSVSNTGSGDLLADVYFEVWRAVEKHKNRDARAIIKAAAGIEQDWRDTYVTYRKLSILLGGNVQEWLESYGDWLIGKPCSGVEYAKKFGGCARNYQEPKNRHKKMFEILDDLAADAINDVINASIENRARLKEAERVPL